MWITSIPNFDLSWVGDLINRTWFRKKKSRKKKNDSETESKWSENCIVPLRVTGSDLWQAGQSQKNPNWFRPIWSLQRKEWPFAAVLMTVTVQSQQHGDRFFQEFPKLCEPLCTDCTVYHAMVTAQCHWHHTGHIKPAKENSTTISTSYIHEIKHGVFYLTELETDPFSLSAGRSRFSEPPTARIQAWGGLIIAEKFLIPNIPKLEIVNVPPW